MRDDALRLSEVVVTAPLKAVEQKGDTTIYNVNAYPTPEGSYLEALVVFPDFRMTRKPWR